MDFPAIPGVAVKVIEPLPHILFPDAVAGGSVWYEAVTRVLALSHPSTMELTQ
jgi:hypothetical protein